MILGLFDYLTVVALAFAVSGLCTVSLMFATGRAVRRLQLRCNDLEDRALQVRGKNASNKRWEEKEWTDKLLKDAGKTEVPSFRFDNDPK